MASGRTHECEDCGDEMPDGHRRLRCRDCKKLVCGWCAGHVHDVSRTRVTPPNDCARNQPFGPAWVSRKLEESERGYGRKS